MENNEEKTKRRTAWLLIYNQPIGWFIVCYCIAFTSASVTSDVSNIFFGWKTLFTNNYLSGLVLGIPIFLASYLTAKKRIKE